MLSAETWRQDITWPMPEGPVPEVGFNVSIEVDLSLARRMLHSARGARHLGGQVCGSGTGTFDLEPPTPTSGGPNFDTQPKQSNGFVRASTSTEAPATTRPPTPQAPASTRPPTPQGLAGARSPTPQSNGPSSTRSPTPQVMASGRSPTPQGAASVRSPTPQATPATPSLARPPLSEILAGGALWTTARRPEEATEQASRAELVRWCFRHTREQISSRLDWLDQAFFSEDHRQEVYIMRESLPAGNSMVGRLWRLYQQVNWRSFPPPAEPNNLDGWGVREGGHSQAGEIITAFETLNFFRWLCGAPRVQMDSFRQELADIVLQTLHRRDTAAQIKESSVQRLRRFAESFTEFTGSEGSRTMIVSHLPGATAAVRGLICGLPGGSAAAEMPVATLGAIGPTPALPEGSQGPLSAYLPLFRLAAGAAGAEEEAGAAHQQRASGAVAPNSPAATASLNSWRVRQIPLGRGVDFATLCFGGLRPDAVAPGTQVLGRRARAWGDTMGVVAFRRCVLDPRLKSTGIQRRGCRVCLFAAPVLPGEPPQMVEQDEDDEEEPSQTFPTSVDDPESPKEKEAATGSSSPRRGQVCEDLKALLRWRERMVRKMVTGGADDSMARTFPTTPGVGPQPQVDVRFRQQSQLQSKRLSGLIDAAGGDRGLTPRAEKTDSQRRTTVKRSTEVRDGLMHLEDERARMEDEVRRPGTPPGCTSGELPLMVCFPPPGIVPVELLEADFLPWTISPDPLRLVPTSQCSVKVFRVRIDQALGVAERLPGGEVHLGSFCVDCTDVGTPFCVIFTLAVPVGAGDQFEVVLSGLGDRLQPSRAVSDLQYFLSFEAFRPGLRDALPVRKGAAELAAVFGASHLWKPAAGCYPKDDHSESGQRRHSVLPSGNAVIAVASLAVASKGPRGPAPSGGGGGPASPGADAKGGSQDPGGLTGSRPSSPSKRKTGRPTAAVERRPPPQAAAIRAVARRYDSKHAPPIGVVHCPGGSGDPGTGSYSIELPEGNELTLGLVVESTIVIKATLLFFVPSQARWETVPRSAVVSYFEEDGAGTQANRMLRLVVRAFLPCAGKFELRFLWNYFPRETQQCSMMGSLPITLEHPLVVNISAASTTPGLRGLITNVLPGAFRRFGYPMKHLLADHLGVTLVKPMRYRLRANTYVRFIVYVHQDQSVTGAEEDLGLADRLYEALQQGAAAAAAAKAATAPTTPAAAATTVAGDAADNSGQDSRRTTRDTIIFAGGGQTPAMSEGEEEVGGDGDKEGGVKRGGVAGQLKEVWANIHGSLANQVRRGTVGSLCIAAVFGPWRRVELLQRRLVEPAPPPQAGEIKPRGWVEDPSPAGGPEVHEVVVRLTHADSGMPVQLMVFQAGNGIPPRPVHSKEADACVEAPPLGAATPPLRWCLAEFVVDTSQVLPYDEEEMAKPPPPLLDEQEQQRHAMRSGWRGGGAATPRHYHPPPTF